MNAQGFKSGLFCLLLVCLSAVASTPTEYANEAASLAPFARCIDDLVKCGNKCCQSCPCEY
jgi:hypothetical protein